MIASGGILVSGEHIKPLEAEINGLCTSVGFPRGEVFKWSPKRGVHWMYDQLIDDRRTGFQTEVLRLLRKRECKVIFVAEDKGCKKAENTSDSHEIDVVKLLVERVDRFLKGKISQGIIICDRPGGDRKQEDKFLAKCLDTLQEGTRYVVPSTISMAILSCPYKLSRMLQAADLVASSILAHVSGEDTHSKPIVDEIKPLIYSDLGRVGGVGVKLHPDYKYRNLYHWLFGDARFTDHPFEIQLPQKDSPFSKSPQKY
jgi:hypothetical protein